MASSPPHVCPPSTREGSFVDSDTDSSSITPPGHARQPPEQQGTITHRSPSERKPIFRVVRYGLVQATPTLTSGGVAPMFGAEADNSTVPKQSGTASTEEKAPSSQSGARKTESGGLEQPSTGITTAPHNAAANSAVAAAATTPAIAAAPAPAAASLGGSSPLVSSTGMGLGLPMMSLNNSNIATNPALSVQSALLATSQQLQSHLALPPGNGLLPQKQTETSYLQSLLIQQRIQQLQASVFQQQGLLGQQQQALPSASIEPKTVPATGNASPTTDMNASPGAIPTSGSSEELASATNSPVQENHMRSSFTVVSTASAPTQEEQTKSSFAAVVEKPKRPLSAYNLFFKDERVNLIKEAKSPRRPHGKKRKRKPSIGFEEMARSIGARWKELGPELRSHYIEQAARDKSRYQSQLKLYNESKLALLEAKRQRQEATVPEETMKMYLATGGQTAKKVKN